MVPRLSSLRVEPFEGFLCFLPPPPPLTTRTMHRLKEKLRSSNTKDATYNAIGALKMALDMFKGVAGNIPVPGLQTGVSGLSAVLDMIQVCAPYPLMVLILMSRPEIPRECRGHQQANQGS